MFRYYLPIVIAVTSNIFYDICAKSIPEHMNAQAGLVLTYITSASCALLLFFITSKEKSFFKEIRKVNWATFALAIGCTGIDLGYIFLFRAGWNISIGSVVCNIFLALSLVFVGALFYKEKITKYHLIGICFCISGLILINV